MGRLGNASCIDEVWGPYFGIGQVPCPRESWRTPQGVLEQDMRHTLQPFVVGVQLGIGCLHFGD